MSHRRAVGAIVVAGLALALVLAFLVSPFASSEPDGLAKVAADKALDTDVKPHAAADSPLAGYGVKGVHDERLSGGLAGVIGVGVTFLAGSALFFVIRARRRAGDAPSGTTADVGS